MKFKNVGWQILKLQSCEKVGRAEQTAQDPLVLLKRHHLAVYPEPGFQFVLEKTFCRMKLWLIAG